MVAVDYRLDNFRQDFTFAVKKGDSELLSKLDSGLTIVMRDGTFDKLYKKWFETENSSSNSFFWFLGGIIIIMWVTFYMQKKNAKNEK